MKTPEVIKLYFFAQMQDFCWHDWFISSTTLFSIHKGFRMPSKKSISCTSCHWRTALKSSQQKWNKYAKKEKQVSCSQSWNTGHLIYSIYSFNIERQNVNILDTPERGLTFMLFSPGSPQLSLGETDEEHGTKPHVHPNSSTLLWLEERVASVLLSLPPCVALPHSLFLTSAKVYCLPCLCVSPQSNIWGDASMAGRVYQQLKCWGLCSTFTPLSWFTPWSGCSLSLPPCVCICLSLTELRSFSDLHREEIFMYSYIFPFLPKP